ncbi:MAG: hypothetical protein IJG59_05170 [Erysipelotrichaceae bacterium]|nr:hypothetical protein [Erysipelotrichaceae bacterium]
MFIRKSDVVGVDVSEYQDVIDMSELARQNVSFVIIRATEGSSLVDARFAENWENVHQTSLIAGAYHFFSFDSPGATQAENFINTVGDLRNDLIPVVDVEFYGDKNENPPAKENVRRELKVYLDILEERYGVKPMIYCAKPIGEDYIKDAFGEYPLWVRSVYYPAWFEFGNKWTMWQYQDTGILDGYSGGEKYIDLNVLNRNVSLEDIMVKQ